MSSTEPNYLIMADHPEYPNIFKSTSKRPKNQLYEDDRGSKKEMIKYLKGIQETIRGNK